MSSRQSWDTKSYQRDTGFVSAYGEDVLSWLQPQAGERILDLGCGDGVLTQKIAQACAHVVGVDASESFVETARATGLDALVVDAHNLAFANEFDAVFSNAAMHWMLQPEQVIAAVGRALRPGGRFVAEFGGFGNVAAIVSAMHAVGEEMGGDTSLATRWFFPTVEQYQGMLETGGFRVEDITSFYRPTPLPTGMRSWLKVMCSPFFDQFDERSDEVLDKVESALRFSMCDHQGQWFADYVRLRFRASLSVDD